MTEEETTQAPQTRTRQDRCPHCEEIHEFEVVTEPGWEPVVYCPRTGVVG